MNEVFTIGYEGLTIETFVEALVAAKIKHLIDVRELPISRKRGFAKTALGLALREVDIAYTHFRSLGSPKEDRHEFRRTKDRERFFRAMDQQLSTDAASADLTLVSQLCEADRVALMCFCSEWSRCHRSRIVNSLEFSGHFSFRHLRAGDDPRQSRLFAA